MIDQNRLVSLLEKLCTTNEYKQFLASLSNRRKCFKLFEDIDMVWHSDVFLTPEGFKVATKPAPGGDQHVRLQELERMLGIKTLPIEGLAYRAAKVSDLIGITNTESPWFSAERFIEYLLEIARGEGEPLPDPKDYSSAS